MAIKDYRAPAVITRRNQRSTDDTYKPQLPTDTVQVSIQTSENFLRSRLSYERQEIRSCQYNCRQVGSQSRTSLPKQALELD